MIGTEELSKFAYAAELADVPLETLQTGLSKLIKYQSAAAQGNKDAIAWLTHRTPDWINGGSYETLYRAAVSIGNRLRIDRAWASDTVSALLVYGPTGADAQMSFIPEVLKASGKLDSYPNMAAWIARIEGSYSGIMGLPLFETAQLLNRFGFSL